MIWGGAGGNFRNEFIFSREPLPYKNFFLEKYGGAVCKINYLAFPL